LVTDVGVGVVEFLRGNGAAGGKVIINSPVYHGFWHWLEELDIEIVDVPLKANYDLDIEGIEKQFASGVKYLLLCNPQNPVGKVFRKSELQELARVANKHGAVVISDEIHAPLVYKDHEFAPYLSCGTDAEETGVCITSASKSWNLAGLKGAFVITASPKMLGMLNNLPEAAHWRSSILAAFAMVEAFENGRDWLDETVEKLDLNRHHLKAELARLLPSANYEIPESTYLAWIDVEQWGLGEKTVETLIEHAKVALVPGNEHGPEYTNFVRFNFGTSPELITEGLTRIADFLNK
jgi:cystathionine beta-lyase